MKRYKPGKTKKPGLKLPSETEVREVARWLEHVDAARACMQRGDDEIWSLGLRSVRVGQTVKAFRAAGGVTAEDWRAFVAGQPLRGCVRQSKHLRLVSSRKRRTRPLTAETEDTGGTAA